jgi:Domain of unknown function (DUF6134)
VPKGFCVPHLLATFLAFFAVHPALASDQEKRVFSVAIDDKPAGTFQLTMQKRPDGSIAVSAQADIEVRMLLARYKYTYRGAEVWKDGRLVSFESTTDDDGKHFHVTGTGGKEGVAFHYDGKEIFVRGDVWLTTYGQLPSEARRGDSLVLVDADTGKRLNTRLQKAGTADVSAGGGIIRATRYKLTGSVKAELWYDDCGRLVRQESMEEGHKTVLELTRLERQ